MSEASKGNSPAIAIRDLSVSFLGTNLREEIDVLRRIDLEVGCGEFVCIIGPSGCGKTTLLNVIGGFLQPSGGAVLVQGERVCGPDRRRIFLFQEGGVFPWLTVLDNVGFGIRGKSRDERNRIVHRYVKMVGLSGFEASYPHQLSGGMRQRVEIARALAADPEIIYMDEPFGALDFFTRLKMRVDLARIWQQERKTVVLVTHDIDDALQLADRVVVLSTRPAVLQLVVPVGLPRPRDPNSADYLNTRAQVLESLGRKIG